jgi:hypothetical protein
MRDKYHLNINRLMELDKYFPLFFECDVLAIPGDSKECFQSQVRGVDRGLS